MGIARHVKAALTRIVKPGIVTLTDNGTVVCKVVANPSSGKATCIDMTAGVFVAACAGNSIYSPRQASVIQT